MRLIPGYEVYWRDTGVTQIGVDPRCAVVLTELRTAEQALLNDLPHMFDINWLHARGNELGLTPAQVSTLQQRLADSGVLIDASPAADLTADERYWQLAARAGVVRTQDRARGVVELRCTDQLGLNVGTVLAEAGVGTIVVDPAAAQLGDELGSGKVGEQGRQLKRTAAGLFRSANPHVRTSMSIEERPDIVVSVDHHVVDPIPIRALVRAGTPHLPVVVTELTVRIGPFTRPGEGACSTCLELHRSETDRRWAAVATQAALRRPALVETTLSRWTAVSTAQQVLAVLDGREVSCESATLESTAWEGVPRRQVWQPHPRCLCRPSTSAGAAAEADRDATRAPSGSSAAA